MTYGTCTALPYNTCNTNELKSINSSDRYFSNENFDYDRQHDKPIELVANNICDDDLDIKISNLIDCKYYSVEEFKKIDFNDNFSIFHNNVNGLETKFDLLHNLIASVSPGFDLIAITETSHKDNEKFKSNIKIDNYNIFSTATNTAKGGTSIFTSKKFYTVERQDLKVQHDHYEAVWIELINKNHKNIICGSLYRHPHDTVDLYNDFLSYLESCISKITKEGKTIYLCGDFNSDLLKYDNTNNYKKFYDLLSSYGIFPMILLPTRVSGDSATIVDNIFTNNIDNPLNSGNIKTDLSDHYSQFISIQNQKMDLKTITIYKRDYSKFSEESFRDDVSIQNFNNNFNDVNEQFQDFYFKLEGCVNRHAPIKKLTPKEIKLKQKQTIYSQKEANE